MNIEKILKELRVFTEENGLNNVSFKILSESGNLIVHLSPYKIVARIAVYDTCNKTLYNRMLSEIKIVNFLERNGLDVISSNVSIPSGPHKLSDYYFTLWKFEEKDHGKKYSPELAMDCLEKLADKLIDYNGDLPILGVWKRVGRSAENLRHSEKTKIIELVNDYDQLNKYFLSIDPKDLKPSHGDAHAYNLFPTSSRWLWSDFEDASLMPKYWDWVSLLANTVLFKGLDHPIFKQVMKEKVTIEEREDFFLVLRARILMSIIGNLDYGLRGLGDLEFAELQVDHYDKLMKEIRHYTY